MSKLLHAGIRRYTKSLVFWLSVVSTIIIAIWCGYDAREASIDDVYIIAELTVMAVLITWLVGRESDEGTFRNKMIVGHSKGSIFLSELILAMVTCVAFFVVSAAIVAVFSRHTFSVVPVSVWIRIFFSIFLVKIAMVVIFVSVSCLVPHRAIMAIINVLLVFGLFYASYDCYNTLNISEYYTDCEYEYKETLDEDGQVCMEEIPIPGTEKQIKNPGYVGGWKRKVLQGVSNILPTGCIITGIEILAEQCVFEIQDSVEENENAEYMRFSITEEEDKGLTGDIIYTFALVLIISSLGYMFFRKKDFR